MVDSVAGILNNIIREPNILQDLNELASAFCSLHHVITNYELNLPHLIASDLKLGDSLKLKAAAICQYQADCDGEWYENHSSRLNLIE